MDNSFVMGEQGLKYLDLGSVNATVYFRDWGQTLPLAPVRAGNQIGTASGLIASKPPIL
jgi:hypothetical protein